MKLLNSDKLVEDADKITFFMPSGTKAEKTLLKLKASEYGHPEATFNDVILGEVSAPCPAFNSH